MTRKEENRSSTTSLLISPNYTYHPHMGVGYFRKVAFIALVALLLPLCAADAQTEMLDLFRQKMFPTLQDVPQAVLDLYPGKTSWTGPLEGACANQWSGWPRVPGRLPDTSASVRRPICTSLARPSNLNLCANSSMVLLLTAHLEMHLIELMDGAC